MLIACKNYFKNKEISFIKNNFSIIFYNYILYDLSNPKDWLYQYLLIIDDCTNKKQNKKFW